MKDVLYVLANTLLNPVAQGAEAGFLVPSMLMDYQKNIPTLTRVTEWFQNPERQIVIKKGGTHQDLAKVAAVIMSPIQFTTDEVQPYPFFIRRESKLNNAITSIGILLPQAAVDDLTYINGYVSILVNTIRKMPHAL